MPTLYSLIPLFTFASNRYISNSAILLPKTKPQEHRQLKNYPAFSIKYFPVL